MKRNVWYVSSLQKVYLIGPHDDKYDFALVYYMASREYGLTLKFVSDKLYHNETYVPLSNADIVRLVFTSEIKPSW